MNPFPYLDKLLTFEPNEKNWNTAVKLADAFVSWATDAALEDAAALREFLVAQDAALSARSGWFSAASSRARFALSGDSGEDRWSEACQFRSGVAFLTDLGGPWWADTLQPGEWDDSLAWHAEKAGAREDRDIPDGIPDTHTWWFVDAAEG